MSTPPVYTYDPITPSDFRLFHITSIDPQIQFRLESFDIEEFPDYEALSYAWGTSVETESALCNGAAFTISCTLGDALRALHKHAEHWIWVDAICINQADSAEKAHQVAGMGDVYFYAERVMVWLGEAADDSDMACNLLPGLNDRVWEVQKEGGWRVLRAEEVVALGLPPAEDPLWKAVLLLYSRPWFQRLWTVQEVTLARECVFLCGKQKVEWEVLHNYAQAIKLSNFIGTIAGLHVDAMGDELTQRSIHGITMLTSSWKIQQGMADPEKEDIGIWNAVAIMQSQSTALKVDYVYGVRDILPDALREKVVVDYSDEVQQNYGMVHAKFFKHCLEVSACHDWPSFYFPPIPTISGIPSWCPPWGTGLNFGSFPSIGCRAGRPAATSNLPSFNEPYLPASRGEEGTLRLAGIAVDTVREIICLDQAFNEKTQALDSRKTIEIIQQLAAYMPAGADGPERLLGIFIGERGLASAKFSSGRPEGPLLDGLLAYMESRATDVWTTDDKLGRLQWWRTYNSMLWLRWSSRGFAVTDKGRIALLPSHTRRGDTVCLFLGARLPQVVSRHENGEHWTYIGPAAVDGLMHGEFFDTTKDWMSKKQTFCLR